MNLNLTFKILAFILIFIIVNCGKSPEKARIKLGQMNINYNEDNFFEYIKKGDNTVVNLFLIAGMDPNTKDNREKPALMIATKYGQIHIVRLLIKKETEVNAIDKDGRTALMIAAKGGYSSILQTLLNNGANISIKDRNGDTALNFAAKENHKLIFNKLLKNIPQKDDSEISSAWLSLAQAYLKNSQIDSLFWSYEQGKGKTALSIDSLRSLRSIMDDLKQNTILFNENYEQSIPMWFIQWKENYRKDICVIDLNLLNSKWYIKKLRDNYPFCSNKILIELGNNQIDNLQDMYWPVNKTVKIEVRNDEKDKIDIIKWNIGPTIDNKAIRVQDLLVLHIISKNLPTPIYFSKKVAAKNRIGLDDYLKDEGNVYHLLSHK